MIHSYPDLLKASTNMAKLWRNSTFLLVFKIIFCPGCLLQLLWYSLITWPARNLIVLHYVWIQNPSYKHLNFDNNVVVLYSTAGEIPQLEASMIVADKEHIFNITGSGNVISPPSDCFAIGSGGHFALCTC